MVSMDFFTVPMIQIDLRADVLQHIVGLTGLIAARPARRIRRKVRKRCIFGKRHGVKQVAPTL